MTEPALHQQPENLFARAIWLVAAASFVVSAGLIAVAWLLVIAPPAAEHPVAAPSPLERRLFDTAARGAELRAAGARRLERYDWVDRAARVVRIPVERAIDAVVADPGLIGSPSPAIPGEVGL